MKPIQGPTVADLLTHAFGTVGRSQYGLDSVVIPTIQVGELGAGFAPPRVRSAASRAVQTAVAGEWSLFTLSVPAGVVAEITEIVATPASNGSLEIDFEDNITEATTAATQAQYTDTRVRQGGPGPGATPSAVLLAGTRAGGLAGEYAIPMTTDGLVYRPKDWIVGRAPFAGAAQISFFFETAVNEQAILGLQWREWSLS